MFLSDNLSSILVYMFIFSLSMNESQKIEQDIQQMNRSLVSFQNVDQLFIHQREPGDKEISGIKEIHARIDYFSYEGRQDVLAHLSFDAVKGDSILIEGSNGSGKSTLVKILTNLIREYQGTVTINGINIKEIKPSNLYKKIIYIPQEDTFIDDTVLNYLRLTADKPELSEAEIKECFHEIDLDIDSAALLDLSGSMLSGGQKKKLQLARLMLSEKEGKMIILDEAEAALDADIRTRYIRIINDIIARGNAIVFIIQHSDTSLIRYNKKINLQSPNISK
jgi:subfamily B ATP-binding cassette protein MsbA